MLVSGCQTSLAQSSNNFDIIVAGGNVFDGNGSRLGTVDIGIRKGQIASIEKGLSERSKAGRIIDASGSIVAPGFIDPHTHTAGDLISGNPADRANLAYAHQGVTTVLVGNDGHGFPQARDGHNFASTGTNFAFLSGFGDIRKQVIGDEDRPASDDVMARMTDLLKQDFCAGAFGFSTGLYYAPQSFASIEEVTELARTAGKFGGYYDTHLRDESDFSVGVLSALDEALKIGGDAEVPVHIAHIKTLGPAVWGLSNEMISRIEAAREAGQRVTADQYPWRASGTRISSALVPKWALAGGLESLRSMLQDPEAALRIKQEIAANIERRGGADTLLVTGSLGPQKDLAGQTLADLAESRESTPEGVAMQILVSGDARLASFNMSTDDIAAFADQPWVMTGSDGSDGHPRKYASYPKVYHDWVRSKRYGIGWFIRRSSGLPADMIGLEDRGYLRTGMAADIVVFDPAEYAPEADFEHADRLSRGVIWLFVNGMAVIERGEHNSALPGKLLRKSVDTNKGCLDFPR